ncbi:MAG: inositol monophosphatase [Ruminococcaceae bacterium]|nr:inositol monophosphatase [Oscillospiraceae bacterium]
MNTHTTYHPSRQLVHDIFYAVREAGFMIRDARRDSQSGELSAANVTDKDTAHAQVNFVTAYDQKVQAFLIEKLQNALPVAKFLAEEDGADKTDPNAGLCFVVDPIDGTANFIRGLSCSAVSVALLSDGVPILGMVYQPYAGELFVAVKGEGTHLYYKGNPPERVSVSNRSMKEAVAVLGTSPYYKDELGETTVSLFKKCFYHAADVRRSGSAAYDFCNIAMGRTDLFCEARLSPWDYAAGFLIVTEAGGQVTQLEGSPLRFDIPCSVLAAGKGCFTDAAKVLNE